jgi:hypothetical protein
VRPDESIISGFLTLGVGAREQSLEIPFGASNIGTSGKLVTAQVTTAHRGRIPPNEQLLPLRRLLILVAQISHSLICRNQVRDHFPSDMFNTTWETVVVEPRHRCEVRGQGFALAASSC